MEKRVNLVIPIWHDQADTTTGFRGMTNDHQTRRPAAAVISAILELIRSLISFNAMFRVSCLPTLGTYQAFITAVNEIGREYKDRIYREFLGIEPPEGSDEEGML